MHSRQATGMLTTAPGCMHHHQAVGAGLKHSGTCCACVSSRWSLGTQWQDMVPGDSMVTCLVDSAAPCCKPGGAHDAKQPVSARLRAASLPACLTACSYLVCGVYHVLKQSVLALAPPAIQCC
jgi:hypothetical protein